MDKNMDFLGLDLGVEVPNLSRYNMESPRENIWADDQFRILREQIQLFEASLDEEHEVGLMMTNFGQTVTMQVMEITYENPVLMIFRGYVNGRRATLIQHINQLNFMLTSVPVLPNEPKRSIGFIDSSREIPESVKAE